MNWTVRDIIEATGGELVSGNPEQPPFTGINTDTRTLKAGELFCALKGPRFDGHAFLHEACQKGAGGVLVSSVSPQLQQQGYCQIRVKDTLAALGELARYHRRRLPVTVVGITGSNGKTSTKEMTAHVLARAYPVLKSPANHNNLIGLPLTLLQLEPHHRVAVVELGTNMPGEMARLAQIAGADIGVLTNIHPTHLAFLGSVQQVRAEKGKLLESLDEQGAAVLNGDDEAVRSLASRVRGRVVTFGLSPQNDIRGEAVRVQGCRGISFQLVLAGEKATIRLPVLGTHNVYNALAAASVASLLGLDLSRIREGLQHYTGIPKRLELFHLADEVQVLNDSYNANPASLRAAIATLATLPKRGKHILVVGDMLELGEAGKRLHQEIGQELPSSTVDHLITVGPLAAWIAQGAREAGMPSPQIAVCTDQEEAWQRLVAWLGQGDTVLIKGSRGMQMWQITERLLARQRDL
ncbi:MAG: UDP-N-acetylmuramoyl-tripeptide--D-alanyl-D-alanine ligase [Nitrospinota bacterium]|nr:MAG: UDP-N-acetylmuramoyl-tripeptide--D-alanyl-D-alanine ligase [Nitrospinota bacterium]